MDDEQAKKIESDLTEEVGSIQRRKKNLSYQMKLIHRERAEHKEKIKAKNVEINKLRTKVSALKEIVKKEIASKTNAIQMVLNTQSVIDRTDSAIIKAYGNNGLNKVRTYRNQL